MLASQRSWTSVEIAQSTLKIVSEAGRAEHLVGAILAGDPRFERSGSSWRARPSKAPTIRDLSYLLADAPRPRVSGQPVSIYFRAHRPTGPEAGELFEVSPDGRGLDRLAPLLKEEQVASMSAPVVRRQLHWLESAHALPSVSDSVLDLAAVLRLGQESIPEVFGRTSIAPVEERLTVCREILESVFEKHGTLTLADLDQRIAEALGGEPIDFGPFRFGPELLDEIPEQPGVYRFHGEDGTLLYVGKSRNLRRRLRSYFRPLAPDHSRRRELITRMRDLRWEVVPSELEALVLESESIRREHPLLNRKIDLHDGLDSVAVADRDLAFIAADAGIDAVSLFLLRDGCARARARIATEPAEGARGDLLAIVELWMSGGPFTRPPLAQIEQPESLLVLRYLRIFGDRIDRLRLADFSAADEVVEALIDLVGRPRPGTEAWLARGNRRPPGGP
jgi:hypothetical protein